MLLKKQLQGVLFVDIRSLLHKIRLPGTAYKYVFRKDPQIREQCTLLPEQCTLFPEDLPISMSSGKNAHTLYGNIVRPSWKSVHSSRKRIHRIFVRSSGNSVHSCIKMIREQCTLFRCSRKADFMQQTPGGFGNSTSMLCRLFLGRLWTNLAEI